MFAYGMHEIRILDIKRLNRRRFGLFRIYKHKQNRWKIPIRSFIMLEMWLNIGSSFLRFFLFVGFYDDFSIALRH